MTDYTVTHSLWMWLYFGVFGSAGVILFTLIVWHSMKVHALVKGHQRSAARWSMVGYMFLFFAAWFACGIGGPPGNMLSPDPAAQNAFLAIFEATLSMFFSVPGWACVLVGQRKMLQGTQSE
jgi:bacteriorhodopsin